ncbi:MAG: calcium/sodium antiporter [Psychroflexus sp.]|nr:calcium/sodium antiporter [Psychroflexus sp.]MDN6309981.1 calcium/sodium antiporter [Psychroflexus sp.]
MDILLVFLGFTALVVGGEFLVRSSVALSFKLNISKMIIALTVVSFSTSAPELIVSMQAALNGYSDIALGSVVGSNIANIGLVLGVTAIISSISINRDFYFLNWPIMLLFSGLFYYFLYTGHVINSLEGLILLAALFTYLFILIRKVRGQKSIETEEVSNSLKGVTTFKIVVWFLIGGLGLYFGSEWLVDGAVSIAEDFGVSERVISVTMVAIGTSVPELAASLIAAFKGEKAISLGNLIGSNIFNIGSVIGITALIQPIKMQSIEVLTHDMLWMIAFALLILVLALLPKRHSIGRYKGFLILIPYIVFIVLSFRS